MVNINARRLGKLGGRAMLEQYGREHFSTIGKIGTKGKGRRKKTSVDNFKETAQQGDNSSENKPLTE